MRDWKWYGHPLHFICSYDCKFHLATELPSGYLVSTIGDYFPQHDIGSQEADSGKEIGLGRKFETMVFKITGHLDCGCPDCDFSDLDCVGYNTHAEANLGHMATCLKWANGAPVDEE